MVTLHLRLEPRDGEPFRHEVRADAVVIGRSSKADVVLADRFLSRMHARLFRKDDAWFLEDLGSRNTTFLNDRPLGQPTVVRPGDVIRLAESRLIVEGPEKPAPAGDGLVGGPDERLPGSTVLRSATLFLSPEREAPTQGEAVVLAGRLRVLNEVHRALAAPITLEALLELVLDRAFVHLRPEEGAIFLRRPDGSLQRAASRQAPGEQGEPLFSRRLVREVVDKGVAALVTDASLDERFAASESIVVSGVRSLVAAPLLDSEGCLGMIALGAKRRPLPFGEDDMELLVALASAAALRLRNLALSEETARRRLLDRELELAHDIQMAMLPRAFPERPEIDVAAALQPARSVGGDLYDVVAEGDRVWLLVGDVSGKGVGAALFMAVTKTLFRALAPSASSVAAAMDRVNRELARDNERAMFVTAFAARLDVATGELEHVNAGHNPTYRREAGGGVTPLGGTVNPALGAVEGHTYQGDVARLRPGELLLMYTDGVVEARSASGEEFHALRLESYLAGSGGAGADAVVRGLLERVEEFAGDTPQYDDVTVLALRWLGPREARA
ncbi:MAG TPA: SpoIIE family protein phosphatase [Vicinamibacteria bacterium]|nr:SpoIIE family protein phosphatase [Vicinamibacteria bacterium]